MYISKKSIYFRKTFQSYVLCIPFVSKIIKLMKSRLFSKVISLFLECGYTLSESMYHVTQLERNLIFKDGYTLILEKIKKGERFSKSVLFFPKLFPRELSQFAALGEESGNLSKTMHHLSLLFDEELKEIEKRMFSLIEPALMLFLGIVVGCIALALITPIYSLTTTLSQVAP